MMITSSPTTDVTIAPHAPYPNFREARFRAMGTDWCIIVEADERANDVLHAARQLVEQIEQSLSRFRPDSDLSRLNRRGNLVDFGHLQRCSMRAVEAWRSTSGLFNPCLGLHAIANGYDRTFEEINVSEVVAGAQPSPPAMSAGVEPLRVSWLSGDIELAPDAQLDLGGIGKGYAAEQVADMCALHGACLVNAGGDIAVRGVGPADGSWPIEIPTSGDRVVIHLERGGVATSGVDRRRWLSTDGQTRAHVIDPRTGRSSETDIVRVTVVAESATVAESWATALLVLGSQRATSTARERGMHAIIDCGDGNVHTIGDVTKDEEAA